MCLIVTYSFFFLLKLAILPGLRQTPQIFFSQNWLFLREGRGLRGLANVLALKLGLYL